MNLESLENHKQAAIIVNNSLNCEIPESSLSKSRISIQKLSKTNNPHTESEIYFGSLSSAKANMTGAAFPVFSPTANPYQADFAKPRRPAKMVSNSQMK